MYEADLPKWESILSFAVEWGFPEVKELAVRQLESIKMSDCQRIILYHKYQVDQTLLEPAVLALVGRDDPLTFSEGTELGQYLPPKIAWGLVRLRELARSVEKKDGGGGGKARVAAPLTINMNDVKKSVHQLLSDATTESKADAASSTKGLETTGMHSLSRPWSLCSQTITYCRQ